MFHFYQYRRIHITYSPARTTFRTVSLLTPNRGGVLDHADLGVDLPYPLLKGWVSQGVGKVGLGGVLGE